MRRRLLHLSFDASLLQLLLSESAVDSLSNLASGLQRAAHDSSICTIISRRSQAKLQDAALQVGSRMSCVPVMVLHK